MTPCSGVERGNHVYNLPSCKPCLCFGSEHTSSSVAVTGQGLSTVPGALEPEGSISFCSSLPQTLTIVLQTADSMLTLTNERGELVFVNQNSIIVLGFASQVWIAKRRLQAVTPECARVRTVAHPGGSICPSSRHLHPFQQNLILISFFKNRLNSYCVPIMKAFFERKSKLVVLPPSTPYEMSWVGKKHKLYQTKGSSIWNIMCSFQQGGKLHLLSSDMSFFKVLLIFRYIFLVCVLIKLPNQPSGLHQCKGFWEDYCILYPCGYKDTGIFFLFPFNF